MQRVGVNEPNNHFPTHCSACFAEKELSEKEHEIRPAFYSFIQHPVSRNQSFQGVSSAKLALLTTNALQD